MISFSCYHCGMKLKVKPEFAGRSSRCPTCKKPLVIPAPDKTHAEVAAGQIDGTDSSLAKAGVEGSVTLEQATRRGSKSVGELLARRAKKDGRYIIEGEIARGGMGMVLRAVDCDIRREVAVKYLIDQSDARKRARFVEEAQITGQLEHPNIVPIHELGVDNLKRLFFSMKMVKGRSLAQVLDELRQHPKQAEKEYSLGRLLNILVNVCNALAYAHARGVVHRDLKPANLMIGDFGEVYVMDWGLAKVLKGDQAPAAGPTAISSAGSQNISARPSSKVATSREAETDLTQEGSVLGTPVYMPPEQANGSLQAIDQRSDVYSLGAILYEMLTLQPPIDKEGGYLAILMRVMQGEIVQPEQRDPKRARAGKIPHELSAITMKALAKESGRRYPNVEALRKDIERFQEGRTVSAKEYTTKELVWKLVKRNKVASAFTFLLAGVLVWSFGIWYQGQRETAQAQQQTALAQQELHDQVKKSVPVFVDAARLYVDGKKLNKALEQLDVALIADPTNNEALLLKGQILMVRKEFAAAKRELDKYLKQRPNDADARQLAEFCAKGDPNDAPLFHAIANVFQRQQVPSLAEQVTLAAGDSLATRQQLLPVYQNRIEAAWTGLGTKLSVDKDGKLHLDLTGSTQVTALQPLNGLPLTSLNLSGCERIQDLAPLKGMPITTLSLYGCGQLSDLTPLKGLPLTSLSLRSCGRVSDLMPLKDMPLTNLNLRSSGVSDLTPLKGLPLTSLDLTRCLQVSDLMPLKGLPLTNLDLTGCILIKDLTPLRGMRLTALNIGDCNSVQDLSSVDGMNFASLEFVPKNITNGMDSLRRMKSLKTITVRGNKSFPADEFWKRYDAGEFK